MAATPRPEPQDGQHTTPKHREKADGTSPGPQPHCNLTESYPNVTAEGPLIRGAPAKDRRPEATAPGAHWVPPTSLSPHCQTPGTPLLPGPKSASTRVSNHSHPSHGCHYARHQEGRSAVQFDAATRFRSDARPKSESEGADFFKRRGPQNGPRQGRLQVGVRFLVLCAIRWKLH